ncbi:unnamed protein product, partial [Owenia fusiformis]
NDILGYYGEAVFDELFFWDSWKHGDFIEAFFDVFSESLAYYAPMEEVRGNTIPGAGLSGTVYNNPVTVKGRVGKGISLNGINQYVNLFNPFADLRQDCFGDLEKCEEGGATLSFWMKIGSKDSKSDMYYFSSGGQTEKSHGITVLWKNGKL